MFEFPFVNHRIEPDFYLPEFNVFVEYWAKKVIDKVRGINPGLESIFDVVYSDRPI